MRVWSASAAVAAWLLRGARLTWRGQRGREDALHVDFTDFIALEFLGFADVLQTSDPAGVVFIARYTKLYYFITFYSVIIPKNTSKTYQIYIQIQVARMPRLIHARRNGGRKQEGGRRKKRG